jgi:hypothetical protein
MFRALHLAFSTSNIFSFSEYSEIFLLENVSLNIFYPELIGVLFRSDSAELPFDQSNQTIEPVRLKTSISKELIGHIDQIMHKFQYDP